MWRFYTYSLASVQSFEQVVSVDFSQIVIDKMNVLHKE